MTNLTEALLREHRKMRPNSLKGVFEQSQREVAKAAGITDRPTSETHAPNPAMETHAPGRIPLPPINTEITRVDYGHAPEVAEIIAFAAEALQHRIALLRQEPATAANMAELCRLRKLAISVLGQWDAIASLEKARCE